MTSVKVSQLIHQNGINIGRVKYFNVAKLANERYFSPDVRNSDSLQGM